MNNPEYDRFAEFYDHVPAYRHRRDVAFYVDLAREAGGPVLEAGCGTGRVLLPCARAGATMVGVDVSRPMLDVLRRWLREEPPEVQARVRLVEGDMRALDLGERFPLVTLPFRAFQHLLTPADQRAALRCLRRHLAHGGHLVLDLFNPSIPLLGDVAWARVPVADPPFTMPDGRRVTRAFRVVGRDFVNQVLHVELIVDVAHADGRTDRLVEPFAIRYLFRYEAEYLLECEGFSVEAVYGDHARSPFGSDDPGEIVIVARRR